MSASRLDWPTRILATVIVVAALLGLFMTAWPLGVVSRVKLRAQAPDGRIEAVCRGRLPESTEYDLWLRRWWQPWGSYAAHSGTESMGRCRDIVWSPDGSLVVVVNEGNVIAVIDAEVPRLLGIHGLAPGEGGSYPSARIITSFRFVSASEIAFAHCDRLWFTTHRNTDVPLCGADVRQGRARLTRSGPRVELSVLSTRH